MRATILDTITGLSKEVDGPRAWEWAENNWSCDCNRDLWGVLPDTGVCLGSHRFIVVAADLTAEEDAGYTIADLNSDYE